MKAKCRKKGFIALMCAIALLVTSLTVIPRMEAKASDAFDGFEDVTLSDFGIQDGMVTGTDWNYNSIHELGSSSLDKKSINFKIRFMQAGMLSLATTDTVDSAPNHNNGILVKQDGTNVLIYSNFDGNWPTMTFPAADIGISNLLTDTISFKIGFEKINDGADVKVIASVNGSAAKSMTIIGFGSTMTNKIGVYAGGPGNSFYLESDTIDDFEDITLSDFGIQDGMITGTDWNYSSIYELGSGSLDKKSLNFKIRFMQAGMLSLATTDTVDSAPNHNNGILVKQDGTNVLIYSNFDGNWPTMTFPAADIGISNLLTDTISFKIGFEKINDGADVKVIASVNGSAAQSMTITGFGSTMTNKIGVYAGGPGNSFYVESISETPIEKSPDGLTKIGWTDFGVTDQGTSFTQGNEDVADGSHYLYANQMDSLLGTSFRGIVKLTRTDTPGDTDYYFIVYGAHGTAWDGLRITLENSNLLIQGIGMEDDVASVTTVASIAPTRAGVSSFKDTQFELGIDLWADENDVKMNLFFNGTQYNAVPYTWTNAATKNYLGNNANLIVHGANDAMDLELSALKTCEITENESGYLLSGTDIYVNDTVKTNGTALTEIGEYHVLYKTDTDIYAEDVVCYISGDAHADGVVDCRDLVAAKKVESGQIRMSKIAKVAALDSVSMRRMLLGQVSAPVAAYSIGNMDKNTMPIGGFAGPYDSLISEQVYQTIADCGINFITSLQDVYNYSDTQSENVIENLKLAEKHNLSVLVTDGRIRDSKTALDNNNLANYLKDYSQYKSFAGLSIIDEPSSDSYGDQRNDTDVKYMDNFRAISSKVNKFSNLSAYVNLLPLHEKMNGDTSRTYEIVYQEYLNKYCREYNPKYLSYDHYPFEWNRNVITGANLTEDNEITDPLRYFKNLAIVRNIANENDIPFWTMVGAGDYWGYTAESTRNDSPTAGQFKWQVNVELAFGAKGIQYFPLIQPPGWELTDGGTADYKRNGLIGANGETNDWYDYAKDMNTQIRNVDHVLMHSANEGLLVTSYGYAKSNMEAAEAYGMPVLSKYDFVTGISTTGTAYGAIAGCFDYHGKTAIYIVNYDVTSTQTITLAIDGTHTYTAINRYGSNQNTVADSLSLGIERGEAVLVVFDE